MVRLCWLVWLIISTTMVPLNLPSTEKAYWNGWHSEERLTYTLTSVFYTYTYMHTLYKVVDTTFIHKHNTLHSSGLWSTENSSTKLSSLCQKKNLQFYVKISWPVQKWTMTLFRWGIFDTGQHKTSSCWTPFFHLPHQIISPRKNRVWCHTNRSKK